VTGTLATGRIAVGDEVEIAPRGVRAVVRGMQSCKLDCTEVAAVARVAVNLRGVDTEALARGDALVAPGRIAPASVIDAAVTAVTGGGRLSLHLGSAAVGVRVRPLKTPVASYVRLTLDNALPLRLGDRGLLRDPGNHRIVAGLRVLDIDPPSLRQRGAAAARAEALSGLDGVPTADDLIGWRGVMHSVTLRRLGVGAASNAVRTIGEWSVSDERWRDWQTGLDALVYDAGRINRHLSAAELTQRLGLPDPMILDALVEASGDLESHVGRIRRRGETPALAPAAEAAVAGLVTHLADHPFDAFDVEALGAAGLDGQTLATAVVAGRLFRVSREIYLLPSAVPLAVERLRQLPETFTVSEARTAWHTTRRVALPLLQHLDAAGWTSRVDETGRRLVR
jgi:selenocysteine-specific elongation factor